MVANAKMTENRGSPLHGRIIPGAAVFRADHNHKTRQDKERNLMLPPNPFTRALLAALLLGLLGYVLPIALTGNVRLDHALLLAVGAFAGVWLGALRRTEAAPEHGDGEEAQTVFVGNLAFKSTDEELRDLFSPYGAVRASRIMRDRKTRRPRGFGFVEMPRNQAQRAIKALDGKEFHGRKLRVREGNRKDVRDEAGSAD